MNIDRLEHIQSNLFASDEELKKSGINKKERVRILRLRTLYTFWQNTPMLSNKEVVEYNLKMHPEIKIREAYEDVKLIKLLIGNLEAESKEWHRYVFNTRIKDIYQRAIEADDLKTAARALADYAKFNRLDELDPVNLDYDQIIPHAIVPTTDPTVIGIKPVENIRERINALKKKLGADYEDAEIINE